MRKPAHPRLFWKRLFWTLLFAWLGLGLPLDGSAQPTSAPHKTTSAPHKTTSAPHKTTQAKAFAVGQRLLPKTIRTKHFTLRYGEEMAWLARRIAVRMEDDYQRIAGELGYQEHAHFEIRMARVDRDYAAIQPHAWTPHAWIAGLAYPRQGLMTLRQQPGQGFPQTYQTFVHELSHLVLFRAARFRPMPLWFVEAVAMQQSNDYTAFDRFVTIASAQASGRIPSIPSLAQRFPADGTSATLAYAVSFAHLQFLRKHAPDLLPRILERLRKGQTFDHALAGILGHPHAHWLDLWQQHLRSHYHWIALLANETLWLGLFCLLLPFFYIRQKALRKQQIAHMQDEPAIEITDDDLPLDPSSLPSDASLSYRELRSALDETPK